MKLKWGWHLLDESSIAQITIFVLLFGEGIVFFLWERHCTADYFQEIGYFEICKVRTCVNLVLMICDTTEIDAAIYL